MAEETQTTKQERKRPTRRSKPVQRKQPQRKPSSPPNRVEPGFIHRKIAATILRAIQDKAATANVPLSVGNLPEPEPDTGESPTDDGREPVELLARIIAHIGHRTPGVRKIEKRLEGNDARSGIGSDILALFMQLISRNEQVAVSMAEGAVKQALTKDKAPEPHWPEEAEQVKGSNGESSD